jgi:hypothetical protein
MEELHCYLENEKIEGDHGRKRRKALEEFDTYLTANRNLIPNWVNGGGTKEAMATGFDGIGSEPDGQEAIRQTPADAMDEKGRAPATANADLLDNRLEETFQKWYPGFHRAEAGTKEKAA